MSTRTLSMSLGGATAIVASASIVWSSLQLQHEEKILSVRNRANSAVLEAAARKTDTEVIKSAEEYFTVRPRRPSHEAEQQVLSEYEAALLRWVRLSLDASADRSKEEVAKFIAINNSVKTGDTVMVRIIWFIAALCLIGAGIQGGRWLSAKENFVASSSPATSSTDRNPLDLLAAIPINTERPVTISFDPSDRGHATSREVKEQVRDWLLMLVLNAARTSAAQLADLTFDSPVLRTGDAGTIANLQYGTTRYSPLPENSMVVLLSSKSSADEKSDAISTSADKYVVRTGLRPDRIYVIEYCIEENDHPDAPNSWRIIIAREPDIEGTRVFSSEFGFISSEILTAGDLTKFLTSASDLVSVSASTQGLAVSGRSYRARLYGHLTVEHIATIWQAYRQVEAAKDRENRRYQTLISNLTDEKLDKLKRLEPEKFNQLNLLDLQEDPFPGMRRLPRRSFPSAQPTPALMQLRDMLMKKTNDEVNSIEKQRKSCGITIGVSQLREKTQKSPREIEALSTVDAIQSFHDSPSDNEKSLLRGALGFSLDPAYNKSELEVRFLAYLADPKSPLTPSLALHKNAILADIRRGQDQLLRCYLRQGAASVGNVLLERQLLRTTYEVIYDPASYQVARYDGGLVGTEVGQILFYTDLLAKLYGMDFDGAASNAFGKNLPEWIPTAFQVPDPVHQEQDERVPETRIWFGLRDDSFRQQEGGVSFSAVATRVFGLSHGIADDEAEVQPSSLDQTWLAFFNNYYGDISASELKYDQLNELIKWSLALDVISRHMPYDSAILKNLEQEQVRRELWFPDWVSNNVPAADKLKWRACVSGKDAGSLPGTVETTKIFHNDWPDAPKDWCGGPTQDETVWGRKTFSIRGGVSLPRLDRVAARAETPAFNAHPNAWRPEMIQNDLSVTSSQLRAQFANEDGYRREVEVVYANDGLKATVRRSATAVDQNADGTLSPSPRQVLYRAPGVELRPTFFEDKLEISGDHATTTIEEASGDGEIGRVAFTSAHNDFRIEYQPLARDQANAIAVTLSSLPRASWAERLASDERVVAVVEPSADQIFAQLRSGEWIEFGRQDPSKAAELPAEWQARNALVPTSAYEYALRWEKPSAEPQSGFASELQNLFSGSLVLVRQVDPAVISERLSTLSGFAISRKPRDDFGMVLQIRGPPNKPPPPNGPGLSFGPEDEPFKGWFSSANGSRAYFEPNGRRVPINDLVKAFLVLDTNVVQEAKKSDMVVIAIPPKKKEYINKTSILGEQLEQAMHRGLRDDPDETLAALKRIRHDYRENIQQAEEADATDTSNELKVAFRAAFLPTRDEIILDAANSLRKRSQKIDDSVVTLVRSVQDSQSFGADLAAKTKDIVGKQDGPSALDFIGQEHLLLAEAVQQHKDSGLEFSLDETTSEVTAAVNNARWARRATSDDVHAKMVYLDKTLNQRRLSEPELLNLLGRDLVAIEIHDPDSRVREGLLAAVPDQITLGPNWVFHVAHSDPEKPSFAHPRGAEEDWDKYAHFAGYMGNGAFCGASLGGSNFCGPPNNPPGGNGGGLGGAGGSSASGNGTAGTFASGQVLLLTTLDALAAQSCHTDLDRPARLQREGSLSLPQFCANSHDPT